MSDTGIYILALLAGVVLGVFFFGGLWLTVQKMPTTRHQALLLIGSFFGRILVTLVGFFLIAGGRWERLLVAVVGFGLARMVIIRVVRSRKTTTEEVNARAVKS